MKLKAEADKVQATLKDQYQKHQSQAIGAIIEKKLMAVTKMEKVTSFQIKKSGEDFTSSTRNQNVEIRICIKIEQTTSGWRSIFQIPRLLIKKQN